VFLLFHLIVYAIEYAGMKVSARRNGACRRGRRSEKTALEGGHYVSAGVAGPSRTIGSTWPQPRGYPSPPAGEHAP
jgi:hypothetical protein